MKAWSRSSQMRSWKSARAVLAPNWHCRRLRGACMHACMHDACTHVHVRMYTGVHTETTVRSAQRGGVYRHRQGE